MKLKTDKSAGMLAVKTDENMQSSVQAKWMTIANIANGFNNQ